MIVDDFSQAAGETLSFSAEELLSAEFGHSDALALEALCAGPSLADAPAPAKAPPRPTTFVLAQGGVFHLTLNMANADDSFFAGCMPLVIWLDQLPADVTVHLYITARVAPDSSDLGFLARFLTILNKIATAKAKIVFIADRSFGDVAPYVAMACREVRCSELAAFSIQPSVFLAGRGEFGEAMAYFIETLRTRGVAMGLLTPEEAEALKTNRSVYLTPGELKARATTEALTLFAPR